MEAVEIMTVEEIAARWRVSDDSVYRVINSGRLKAFRIGKSFRVLAPEVEKFENGGCANE